MNEKKLSISHETSALITCLESLNSNWELTCKALEKMYSEDEAEGIMKEKYNPAFNELKAVMHGFLMTSIERNLEAVDSYKI